MLNKLKRDKEKYTGDFFEDVKILKGELGKIGKDVSKAIKDINKKEIIEGDNILDLSYLTKNEFECHKYIRNRAKEFLLEGESILIETCKKETIGFNCYFITDKRILTLISQGASYKNKKVSVESTYYDNISSVMFMEGDKNISSLVISYKGRQQANMTSKMANIFKTIIDVRASKFDDYTINLYSDVAKKIYKTINESLYK